MDPQADKSEILCRLGRHIAALREREGISGAELARRCLMDRQAVDRIEKGGTNPTFWTLRTIAQALGLTVEELMKGAGI